MTNGSWPSEIRQCYRGLIGTPFFVITAVLTLGIAVALTTAGVGFLHAVLVKSTNPTGVTRLVRLSWSVDGRVVSARVPMPADVVERFQETPMRTVERLSGFSKDDLVVSQSGRARVVTAEHVAGSYFSLLGVQPAAGRLLAPSDTERSEAVAVISEALCKFWALAPSEVVGKTIIVDGRSLAVVGVSPGRFKGLASPSILSTDVWVPARQPPVRYLFAQLVNDASLSDANAEARSVFGSLAGKYPEHDVRLSPGIDPGRPAAAYGLFFIGYLLAGSVVVIAATSVMTLLIARLWRRRAEIALRLAMGATPSDLTRLFAIEVVVIVVISTTFGVVLAALVSKRLIDALLPASSITWAIDSTPDWTVTLLIAAGMAVVGLVVASAIVRRASRIDALAALISTDTGHSTSQVGVAHRRLIAFQVGMSALLLSFSGLAAQSVLTDGTSGAVTRSPRVAVGWLDYRAIVGVSHATLNEELLALLRTSTGAQTNAAVTTDLVGNRRGSFVSVLNPQNRHKTSSYLRQVTERFQEVMALPLVDGRFFTADEVNREAPVVVLSSSLAHQLFPVGSATGDSIWLGDDAGRRGPLLVVGVVADSPTSSPVALDRRCVFIPLQKATLARFAVVVSAQAGADQALHSLLRGSRLAEGLTATNMLDDERNSSGGGLRQLAWAFGLLGVFGLVVAIAGVFGVVSHLIQQRSRELAVRQVLGANNWHLSKLLLAEHLRPLLVGVIAGVILGVLAAVAARQFVWNIRVSNPSVVVLIVFALVLACATACLLPLWLVARRSLADVVRGA